MSAVGLPPKLVEWLHDPWAKMRIYNHGINNVNDINRIFFSISISPALEKETHFKTSVQDQTSLKISVKQGPLNWLNHRMHTVWELNWITIQMSLETYILYLSIECKSLKIQYTLTSTLARKDPSYLAT